jgi:tetratricopeptide (TPR) repeat protein
VLRGPSSVLTGDRPRFVATALALTLAAFVAYWPALTGQFVWDDDILLTNNALVKASDGLYRMWFTTEAIDYWPLTGTSFWIEWRLWGMNPFGYHVTNLLLHLASAGLVWAILRQLSIPGASIAACLFALHPVNVESVAWIVQRKNTLSLVFYLLAAWSFVRHDAEAPGRVGRWYWLSLMAFVAAMLSKGSVAVLPAALLLIAWWRRNTITRRDLLLTAPFFVIAAGFTVLNVWLQTRHVSDVIRDATLIERVLGAAAVTWFYLYKAVLPIGLMFVYPQMHVDAGDARWWVPLIAALAVTAALVVFRHHPGVRAALFTWMYFIVALVPVMGLVDVYFMRYSLVADHYQYVALVGIVAAAGAVIAQIPAVVGTMVGLGIAALLGALTWHESRTFRDVETLYRVTIARNPDAWLAHQNLGVELAKRPGRLEEAIESFKTVLRIYPESVEAHRNLGLAYWRTPGRTDDAIREYEAAIRLNPNNAVDHLSLARLLLDKPDRQADALRHAEQAVNLDPSSWEALETLGGLLLSVDRRADATAAYRAAIDRHPDAVTSHLNLGVLLASQPGRLSEAIPHFETVVRLQPDLASGHYNLGSALMEDPARSVEAARHLAEALRLRPDYLEAQFNLAVVLAEIPGRLPDAIQHVRQLVQRHPDMVPAAELLKDLEARQRAGSR